MKVCVCEREHLKVAKMAKVSFINVVSEVT